jgi:hypothetical protein
MWRNVSVKTDKIKVSLSAIFHEGAGCVFLQLA